MNIVRLMVIAALAALMAACASAPQNAVPLNAASSLVGGSKVGVVMVAIPKPDTSFPGAGCLLCYATASAVNSKLTAHVKTLGTEDLVQLREDLAAALKGKGMSVTVVPDFVELDKFPKASGGENKPNRDFAELAKKFQLDKLVVIEVLAVGVERPYSAYIAVGDPRGVVQGQAYLINLSNQTYEWYQPITANKGVTGNWDEPAAKFPGVTNAYYQAIEAARDTVLQPFTH